MWNLPWFLMSSSTWRRRLSSLPKAFLKYWQCWVISFTMISLSSSIRLTSMTWSNSRLFKRRLTTVLEKRTDMKLSKHFTTYNSSVRQLWNENKSFIEHKHGKLRHSIGILEHGCSRFGVRLCHSNSFPE